MQNLDLKNKTVFITGVAGFIGSNLAERLLKEIEGIKIVGLDNMNDYYDVRLKEYRLEKLSSSEAFSFVKGNLADKEVVNSIFEKYKPGLVVNLGAQAGVRYSITNPDAYIEGNLVGFYNILEGCRHYPVEHLVYASSSSVYGSNKKVPYSTEDKVDNALSQQSWGGVISGIVMWRLLFLGCIVFGIVSVLGIRRKFSLFTLLSIGMIIIVFTFNNQNFSNGTYNKDLGIINYNFCNVLFTLYHYAKYV